MGGGWVSGAQWKEYSYPGAFFFSQKQGNKKFALYVHTFHVANAGTRRKGGYSFLLTGLGSGGRLSARTMRVRRKSPPKSQLSHFT